MSTAPSLRLATGDDLSELARLYRTAARELGAAHYTPEQLEAWASFADEPDAFARFVLDAHTLVAELDGRAVAFGGITRTGHLASLYVRPDRARRGLGTFLARELLDRARGWGLRRVHLEASELSRGTFEKVGFRVEAEEVVERRGARFRRYLMATEL